MIPWFDVVKFCVYSRTCTKKSKNSDLEGINLENWQRFSWSVGDWGNKDISLSISLWCILVIVGPITISLFDYLFFIPFIKRGNKCIFNVYNMEQIIPLILSCVIWIILCLLSLGYVEHQLKETTLHFGLFLNFRHVTHKFNKGSRGFGFFFMSLFENIWTGVTHAKIRK